MLFGAYVPTKATYIHKIGSMEYSIRNFFDITVSSFCYSSIGSTKGSANVDDEIEARAR